MGMNTAKVLGLHHMTAICGPAQENVDFFVGVLGLRFLKLTVNFDDPTAYHLYYGDGLGSPGSILTFFPYPAGRSGTVGNGMVGVTSLSIPPDSMGFWSDRLQANRVRFEAPETVGDTEVLRFQTPDGLPLELVAAADHRPGKPWKEMPIEEGRAISGMRGITLFEAQAEPTAKVVTDVLGLQLGGQTDRSLEFLAPDGSRLQILQDERRSWGSGGHGTVHHIAFRAEDDAAQLGLLEKAVQAGLHASPVMDRNYFHSIYFREPGHVLFEVATDPPGFTVDESAESLGTALKLPPQYEPHRAQIERTLPILRIPGR